MSVPLDTRRPLLAAAAVVVLGAAGVLVDLGSASGGGRIVEAVRMVDSATGTNVAAIGLLVSAALFSVGWHAWHRAAGACLTAAMAVFGLGLVVGQASATTPAGTVEAVARIVAVACVLAAVFLPEVVSVLSPLRAVVAAVGLSAVLGGSLWIAAGFAPSVASAVFMAAAGGVVTGSLPVAIGWALATAVAVRQAWRREDGLLGWTVIVVGSLAFGELLTMAGLSLAGELVAVAGIAVCAAGVAGTAGGAYAYQRRAVQSYRTAWQTTQRRLDARDATSSELRHEAKNALATVSAAATTLDRAHDRIGPSRRQELIKAIASEARRLERLVDERRPGSPSPMPLAEAVQAPVVAARAAGLDVSVDIPSDLVVRSDAEVLAQVLVNLLTNARVHAPGSPIALRAVGGPAGVELRCEDRGPGVALPQRERIFAAGATGPDAPAGSTGLGLSIATRLLHDHGGALRVEPRPGGGASFVVWLPHGEPARERNLIRTRREG